MKNVSQAKDKLFQVELETTQGRVSLPVEMLRSRRARYLRLSINRHNQPRLSIPWYCSRQQALAFLQSKADWLLEQLKQIPAESSLHAFLLKHPHVSGLGYRFHVSFSTSRTRPFYLYSPDTAEIHLCLREGMDPELETVRLIREFASEVISTRARELASAQTLPLCKVSVRDQSSRWGSCSTTRTVSLNWRLVLLEPLLHDHVIYHELAHLTEMNHSPRFWALLQAYDPQVRKHNELLNPAAARLMPLGRVSG